MPKVASFFKYLFDIDVAEDEISQAPRYDGADFVCGALRASKRASLGVRKSIQTDVADTLNCRADSLSFLWAQPVRGAEVLGCEIPDFREFSHNPIGLSLAAE